MISKVLRTLLLIYAIRVSSIQEMICDPNKKITLDALVGRLTAFELDSYDNYTPTSSNLDSSFEAKLSLKKKAKRSKRKQFGSEEEDNSNSDLEAIEALLARRYPKGKKKYKGKIPLICFSCEEVEHIVAICPNREDKNEKKSSKFKCKKELRATRTKVRNLVLWLKILVVVKMMKWFILL